MNLIHDEFEPVRHMHAQEKQLVLDPNPNKMWNKSKALVPKKKGAVPTVVLQYLHVRPTSGVLYVVVVLQSCRCSIWLQAQLDITLDTYRTPWIPITV